MTRVKRWCLYGVLLIVWSALVVYVLFTVISPDPNVSQPPNEVNRVRHPDGYSIIRPGRTRAIVSEDGINISPDGGRSRYTPVFGVGRFPEFPDPAWLQRNEFRSGTFQGHPAFVRNGPSGEYDAYRVITNRGGKWYEITLLIPQDYYGESVTMPSAEWQRYLDTFEAPLPTSLPSQDQ